MAIAKKISSNMIFTPTPSATRFCVSGPGLHQRKINRRNHKRRCLLSHSSRRLRHTTTPLGRGEPALTVSPDASPAAPAPPRPTPADLRYSMPLMAQYPVVNHSKLSRILQHLTNLQQ